jgi:hypothetical protein
MSSERGLNTSPYLLRCIGVSQSRAIGNPVLTYHKLQKNIHVAAIGITHGWRVHPRVGRTRPDSRHGQAEGGDFTVMGIYIYILA